MKMTFSRLLNIILAIMLLTSVFLINATTSRSNANTTTTGNNVNTTTSGSSATNNSAYDPWVDIDGDGVIGPKDLHALGVAWGTTGDPTRNVTVTNWPNWMNTGIGALIATNCLTAVLQSSTTTGASNQITGLGGENITFVGGSLCGGGAWEYAISNGAYGYNPAGCQTPAVGHVSVYNETDGLIIQFALPLSTMLRVQGVYRIVVYAETATPIISGGGASFASDVVASVFWIKS